MVDIVITGVLGAVFYAGFRTGNKYATLKEAGKAALDRISSYCK